jgi:hypothetical protein
MAVLRAVVHDLADQDVETAVAVEVPEAKVPADAEAVGTQLPARHHPGIRCDAGLLLGLAPRTRRLEAAGDVGVRRHPHRVEAGRHVGGEADAALGEGRVPGFEDDTAVEIGPQRVAAHADNDADDLARPPCEGLPREHRLVQLPEGGALVDLLQQRLPAHHPGEVVGPVVPVAKDDAALALRRRRGEARVELVVRPRRVPRDEHRVRAGALLEGRRVRLRHAGPAVLPDDAPRPLRAIAQERRDHPVPPRAERGQVVVLGVGADNAGREHPRREAVEAVLEEDHRGPGFRGRLTSMGCGEERRGG